MALVLLILLAIFTLWCFLEVFLTAAVVLCTIAVAALLLIVGLIGFIFEVIGDGLTTVFRRFR